MPRPQLSPIIDACVAIAKTVDVPVGDGEAPECDMPYIVVTNVSSPRYDGPLDDIEADSSDRIQFSYIGETREQADAMRDKVRLNFTVSAFDAELVTLAANRRTMRIVLDIPRGTKRDERGLPNAIFLGVDQYLIDTTPFTP